MTLGGGTVLKVVGNLNVTSNSTVVCQGANNTGQVSNQWAGVGVTINASNVFVEAASKITADGQGYVASTGTGIGPGGGAYNGQCRAVAAVLRRRRRLWRSGSMRAVRLMGPCWSRWIWVPAEGRGTGEWEREWRRSDSADCRRHARLGGSGFGQWRDAAVGHSGAGSGGSIWVTTRVLRGAGFSRPTGRTSIPGITAGRGGGGRIAVYYQDGFAYSNLRSGHGCGGSGLQNGAEGSIVFMDTSVTAEPPLGVWGR